MTGWLPFAFFIAVTAMLHGCTNLYERPDEITGNNTGGVIPAKLAAKQDSQTLAAAHCAKWGATARITFPASQTGGEAVFICEKPGQPAAPQALSSPEPAPQPKPAAKKKTK